MRKTILALASAASLLLAGVTGAAAAVSHARPDATPSCGSNCVDAHFIVPGKRYLPEAGSGKSNTNNKMVLDYASDSDPSEDFIPADEGAIVPVYCTSSGGSAGAGFSGAQCRLLVNAGLSGDEAFQDEYAPGGFASGECLGAWNNTGKLTGTAVQRLEPCGISADTLVILAPVAGGVTAADGGDFVIDGASSNFSIPEVATASPSTTLPTVLHWAPMSNDDNTGSDTQSLRVTFGTYSA